jgi:putative ATP-dependent endonuclease of OLD family
MAQITSLSIKGYRSIKDKIELRFPPNAPLVLVGENNAGKTNILRAIDLVLGEFWPGSKEPEDHEFWNRDTTNGKIEIEVQFDGLRGDGGTPLRKFRWSYDPNSTTKKCDFTAVSSSENPINYVRSEWRDQCMCMYIGADRRLSYHLSYASKWTLLSKLMHKFHEALTQEQDRVGRLKSKFAEVVQIFQEVDAFAEFQTNLTQQFGEIFEGMSYGLQVDFSAYDPSRFFHSLQVVPKEGDEVRTFEELGTGQEQLLALVFAHAYAKAFYGGIVLAIEEPEAHLHPLAQEWLARKIHQMAADGLQIVITTHSSHFVNVLNLEGLVLVRKSDENATVVCQLTKEQLTEYCKKHGSHLQRTTPETILPFYANQSTQEILNGFFAKKIVLVEGQTEQFAVPVYFGKVGMDVTKEGIAIVPVMGKGNLAKWWRLFTAYGIPTYVIFDNDSKDDETAAKRRDVLTTLQLDNADGIISSEDWLIYENLCVFGKDFEVTMRANFPGYQEKEQEAKEILGDSKPIVARYVASQLNVDDAPGWKKYERLRDAIRNLASPNSAC